MSMLFFIFISHFVMLISYILFDFLHILEMSATAAATQRLQAKRQTLDEAYAPPANFLEIEVVNPVSGI